MRLTLYLCAKRPSLYVHKFFFVFGLMYCDQSAETIQGRKIFKVGIYSRIYSIKKYLFCHHSWYSTNIFQFQTDLFLQMISPIGKQGRREGCGHWKENPFLPTRFMHHPTKKEGCTNFSLSVAVICFYDDGKSISTIKLFPCFFSRFLVLSLFF